MAGRHVKRRSSSGDDGGVKKIRQRKSTPLRFNPFEEALKNFQLQQPTTLEKEDDQDYNRPDRRTEGSG